MSLEFLPSFYYAIVEYSVGRIMSQELRNGTISRTAPEAVAGSIAARIGQRKRVRASARVQRALNVAGNRGANLESIRSRA